MSLFCGARGPRAASRSRGLRSRAPVPAGQGCAGITISRLRDGRIVEDYSAFDSFELLKRLGLWRTLLSAPALLRALRDGQASSRS